MTRTRSARHPLQAPLLALAILGGSAARVAADSAEPPKAGETHDTRKHKAPEVPGQYQVPAPPFTEGIFPCSDCHNADREPDPTPRELSEHDFKFEHDAEHRWCLDCHDIRNYDKLHLTGGQQIDFTESYKLCGQCHGDKYRDWRVGVHGRRTGDWNGQKSYLLCVNCHNPHSPKFKPIKPQPPPVRPENLRRKGD